MKIGVLIKQVPDTAAKIKIRDDGADISTDDVKWVLNPYDEFAVEESIRLKTALGTGEIVVISLGPQRAQEAMRTALAMGADRAIHLGDEAFLGADVVGTVKVFQSVVLAENFDVIFAGKMAADLDQGQTVQALAEVLGWPHVQPIVKFEIASDRKKATAHRVVSGGTKEVIEVPLPAIFGCEKGLNEPRYASLPGIMKAKSKPLKSFTLADSKLNAAEVGAKGAMLKVEKLMPPPERQAGKILKGDAPQVVKQLLDLLRNEAKVI